jgi:hypothetical protein
MTDFLSGSVRPTSLDDRRRRPRRGGQDEHQVTVIDGLGAGERHVCVYREVNADSASLLVKFDLRAGQRVRIQALNDGVPAGASMQGEIVRSRPLTTGRWEVLVEFPRQVEAPKVSESQRRHERRQARIARIIDAPVKRSI